MKKPVFLFFSVIALIGASLSFKIGKEADILSYRIDPAKVNLNFYLKDNEGKEFRSIANLKAWLGKNKQELVFAMNGGMYQVDGSPLGLYISEKKQITPLNTRSGDGNFYLKPNGVFYISTSNRGFVCKSEDFRNEGKVRYATQSGPMLLIEGKIHPEFKEASANVNIRNGVGILANGDVLFAMSKTPVNFYEFANWFKMQGCTNALYLDGAVSRTYLPEKNWVQTDGNFGVIIAVTRRK
jgi:uncharacterized protein YigE (DUF2233 family)